jgi:hypothetical protein
LTYLLVILPLGWLLLKAVFSKRPVFLPGAPSVRPASQSLPDTSTPRHSHSAVR